MTITGSYPSDLDGQRDFLKLVNQSYKNLEAQSSVVTVHSASEPTNEVLLDQWALTVPYAPPTNGSQLQWFNPTTGKIEQVYYPASGGGDVLLPYKQKSSNSAWEYITEQVIGTAATIDIASLPATYRHWLVLYSVRATGAGTATEVLGLRLNNTATATHGYLSLFMTSGSNPILAQATAQTQARAGFVTQGGLTDQAQASVGHIFIPNVNQTLTAFGVRMAMGRCAGFAGNTRPYAKTMESVICGIPVTAIVNRIQLFAVTATTLQRGSKAVIYGMK